MGDGQTEPAGGQVTTERFGPGLCECVCKRNHPRCVCAHRANGICAPCLVTIAAASADRSDA